MTKSLEVELLDAAGFRVAFQAMREPMKGVEDTRTYTEDENIALAQSLIAKGDDHAKHMRLAIAWFNIRAPRYFWSEFDTYRVGVEKESGSTMHRLMLDGLDCSRDCASFHPNEPNHIPQTYQAAEQEINHLCLLWKGAKNAKERNKYLGMAKKLLPEGYLQTRKLYVSYQTLRRIYVQRRNHRLREWQEFCDFMETLPYSELITLKGYKERANEPEKEAND